MATEQTQTQENRQRQGYGAGNSYGINLAPPPAVPYQSAAANNGPCLQDSIANERFKFTITNSYKEMRDSKASRQSFCILHLTGLCSPSGVLQGGYCKEHNKLIRCIVPFDMDIDGSVDRYSFSTQRFINGNYKNFGLLTSCLPMESSPAQIQKLLSNSSLSGEHMKLISKFYSVLTYPRSKLSIELTDLSMDQYMNLLISTIMTPLREDYAIMKNFAITCTFTNKYVEKLSTNKWYQTIVEKSNRNEIQKSVVGDTVTYAVPLTEFNMLDIMAIRTYILDIQLNKTGYAANIGIRNGQFTHGIGNGIYNAAVASDNQFGSNTENYQYGCHNDDVKAALLNATEKQVANLDPLVISCLPLTTKSSACANIQEAEESYIKMPLFTMINSEDFKYQAKISSLHIARILNKTPY